MTQEQTNERKQQAWQNIFVRIASVALILFLIASIVRLNAKANDLVEQRDELAKQVDKYAEEVEELEDQLARPYDDEYIKNVAREKLGLRMPDEIIFYNELIK
ncbi:MAG: septum formation initiator family protein [Clostridiales bacterium]|nr:septum formation initiator family protein [Clostridiales bacterium]